MTGSSHRSGRFVVLFAGMLLAPLASAQAQYFGAVSFSPSSGAQGWGIDFASREQAEEAAFQNCAKQGSKDCEVVAWIENGCVAVATSTTAFGPGWHWSKAIAEKMAIDRCQKAGTTRCTIARWVCTSKSQF